MTIYVDDVKYLYYDTGILCMDFLICIYLHAFLFYCVFNWAPGRVLIATGLPGVNMFNE